MHRAKLLSAVACVVWMSIGAQAQHIHIAAGAESAQTGSRLFFSNGYLYDTNSYGGVTPACIFMNRGDPLYPNLYQTAASFTALPATIWTGGPTPYAAEQGAYIEMILVSTEGPAGGEIALWEENEEATVTTRKFTLPSGTFNGTNRINLSEGITIPDPDPFGHIHGRRFTANKPGLYTLGVQLIDTSTAGPNGGPIHSPSLTNYFYLQAGLFIDSVARSNNTMRVRFGSQAFHNYYLQATSEIAGTNWVTLAEIVGGNHSDLHYLSDTNAITASRFYRIREVAQ